MADQAQDVQAWMEQIHRAAPEVPIVFLLPQEVQPQAQPYLRLKNVYHLSGQNGALALIATAPGGPDAQIAQSTGQLGLAVVVFVILLLIGGSSLLIAQARQNRRGTA
jgi:hypothetical protein